MPIIEIEVKTTQGVQWALDNICDLYGYASAVAQHPTLTKREFASRVILGLVKDTILTGLREKSADNARKNVPDVDL